MAADSESAQRGAWSPSGHRCLAGWLLGAIVFAVYALLTAPTAYLLDSAELAAASFGLGVAHPPGESLALLWGKLFCLLPLGSVAFRVGLSQAAAGAGAAVVLFRLILFLSIRHTGRGTPAGRVADDTGHMVLAAIGALAFAFAPGLVMVSNRPEVYALQTALSLGALLLALQGARRADGRLVLAAALLIGLGVANHPLVAGLTGVGAIVAAVPLLRGPLRTRLFLWALPVFLVGASVLAYLPMRAAALATTAPAIAWGDARTLAGLWWLLSAQAFTAKTAVVHQAAQGWDLPFAFMEELGPLLALAAPVGLWLLLRTRQTRGAGLAVAITVLGSAAAALVAGFDPTNPDIRGYLSVAVGLMSALAVLLPCKAFSTRAWPVPLALVAIAFAVQVARLPPAVSLRGAAVADRTAGDLLSGLPPRAALLTSHFESAFLVTYQQSVEGRRPDVASAHLGFVRGPGYVSRVTAALPELGTVLAAHALGALDLTSVAALQPLRPLRFEPDDHLSVGLSRILQPTGLTWALPPLDPAAARAPAADSPLSEGAFREAGRDRQVRGFLAWRAFADATLACDNGASGTATARLADLRRLAPTDARVLALAARCAR